MTTTNPSSTSGRSIIRGMLTSLAINGVLPYLIYTFTLDQVGSFTALVLSSVPPLISSIVGIIRQRRVDALGAVVLTGIVLSLVAVLLGGSDRLLLIRESFVTGLFGVIFLGSLLFARPIFFYISRQFATGGDPAKIDEWNGLWQHAGFRHGMRVITIVWGVGQLVEAMIRVVLVFMLTIPRFLLISPLILNGCFAGLMAWTFWYSKQMQRRGDERRKQAEAMEQVR